LVVSRHGHFDPGLRFFSQPLRRGLLLSGAAAAAGTPSGFDLHWPLEAWSQTLGQLQRAGLQRLVLLGGAHLAGQLLAAGVVQELQLTLCPQVLAGPHTWVPDRAIPAVPAGWQLLEHRAIGEGELLLRYRSPTASRLTPDPCESAC
jgi:5-amino-6-(5-phosphoribosylamino)uracil reductase